MTERKAGNGRTVFIDTGIEDNLLTRKKSSVFIIPGSPHSAQRELNFAACGLAALSFSAVTHVTKLAIARYSLVT